MLTDYLRVSPLIAILRGLRPDEALDVAAALHDAGFRIIEVPLNSPDPLASIERIAEKFGGDCLVGAGTVTDPADVARIRDRGGRLVVMPHADIAVIGAAKQAGLLCTPGIATPTEGFAALRAGADGLKLFPADALGPDALRAMRAVFPPDARFIPVGGVTPENVPAWHAAGAAGYGLGSALFKPGFSAADVGVRARAFAASVAASS